MLPFDGIKPYATFAARKLYLLTPYPFAIRLRRLLPNDGSDVVQLASIPHVAPMKAARTPIARPASCELGRGTPSIRLVLSGSRPQRRSVPREHTVYTSRHSGARTRSFIENVTQRELRFIGLTSDVKLRAAFQARGHRSGVPLAANELHAASGDLQAA